MSKIHYFDSHAHLTEVEMLTEIEAVMGRAFAHGVVKILNICTTPKQVEEGKALSLDYSTILQAGATPPHTAEEEGAAQFSHFEKAAKEGFFRAIGETGLDYHYKGETKKAQQELLIRYLHLAAECKLPVIFHCREAFLDLFSIVDGEYPKKAPAVLHCFTGTGQEAEEVVARGWHLSLSGIVTFKKSVALQEAAKIVPLSQLLIETDAPYLAPQSKRGKRNEPSFLPETAQKIAALKGVSLEEVARATFENASRLFDL